MPHSTHRTQHYNINNNSSLKKERLRLQRSKPAKTDAVQEEKHQNMSKRKREEDGTKKKKKEEAYIRIDGKQHYFGMFGTPKEAAEAYDLAAIQAGRPTSKLNFLDQVPKNYKPKKKKLSSGNTTGFRGVSKNGNRYQATIYIDGGKQHIGTFDTAKKAAIAVDQAVPSKQNV